MPDPCSLANRPKILLLVGVSLCDDGEVKKRSADSVGMNDPVWLCDKHFSLGADTGRSPSGGVARPMAEPQEHGPDVDADGEMTGVCTCGRKLISELGFMRLYCKKSRPPKRSIKSLKVFCPTCLGRDSGMWLDDEERLADDDIAFGHTGEAECLKCGTTVLAHVGGWDRAVRSHCLGCGDPLEKRQVRWCGRKLGNWSGVCSIAWSTPGRLYLALADLQHDLCGICLRPMTSKGQIQVDHVIPRSVNGPRHARQPPRNAHALQPAQV